MASMAAYFGRSASESSAAPDATSAYEGGGEVGISSTAGERAPALGRRLTRVLAGVASAAGTGLALDVAVRLS